MKRLQDKVAIITGAGSGFGSGMARRFAAEGAKVVLADVNVKHVEDELAEIGSKDAAQQMRGVWVVEIAELFVKNGSRFTWTATMRADQGHRLPDDVYELCVRSGLRRVMIGGSAVPRSMAEAFKSRYGVETLQIWGMTETCPLGVIATPTPALAAQGEAALHQAIWTRQGRLQLSLQPSLVHRARGLSQIAHAWRVHVAAL